MPTIKLELENDVYRQLISCGIDIEVEFKKFLLQKKLQDNNRTEDNQHIPFKSYWDALDEEIKSIKILNSKIFK
jgi:uncharacterized protein (UPF0335 family)